MSALSSLAMAGLFTSFALGAAVAQGSALPPAPAPPPLLANSWRLDTAHSAVRFRIRHLGISWVNGEFRTWQAELIYDPQHAEAASVTARIRTASLSTSNERRDADLRGANYLATDSFPDMVFVSRRVERVDDTHLRVTGELTLRGITRAVALDVEITGAIAGQRARRIAFTAATVIDRREFGVTFNRVVEGFQVVGDEIRITIDVEAFQPVG